MIIYGFAIWLWAATQTRWTNALADQWDAEHPNNVVTEAEYQDCMAHQSEAENGLYYTACVPAGQHRESNPHPRLVFRVPQYKGDERQYELGFRADGVVVWRELDEQPQEGK